MVGRGRPRNTLQKNQAPTKTHGGNTGWEDLDVLQVDKETNLFNKAVKDAERSLLVFNLNLGQTPTINQSTISSKVTVSLLNLLAEKSKMDPHAKDTRDFVDDILSQVTKMDFFGSKTVPSKTQGSTGINGLFYTIPVKLMFKDRKAAQTAAEILRDHLGLNSTTPYHRSLRAAMNHAIKVIKTQNPGYQAKTNLDLNGKTLKCFIRPDVNPPGSWAPYGSNVPLPQAALDTTSRNIPEMNFEVSSNLTSPTPWWRTGKTRAEDTRKNKEDTGRKDTHKEDDSNEMETEHTSSPPSGDTQVNKKQVDTVITASDSSRILNAEANPPTIPGLDTSSKG
jgi:hypothetical protein